VFCYDPPSDERRKEGRLEGSDTERKKNKEEYRKSKKSKRKNEQINVCGIPLENVHKEGPIESAFYVQE
jgi:hypothetical protein